MLRKRRYHEHREIHNDILGEEGMEIVESKPKKKTKKQIDKLKDQFEKAWQGKSTEFINSSQLDTLTAKKIKWVTEEQIQWKLLKKWASQPYKKDLLRNARVISIRDHGAYIFGIISNLTSEKKIREIENLERIYKKLKMKKDSIIKEVKKFMQGDLVLPQFGDLLNRYGQIKLNAKFKSNTPILAKQNKANKAIAKKKKALDVLTEKIIFRSSNAVIKKKFNVNENFITNRMKDLIAGKLDPQNMFKLNPKRRVKFDQFHLNHIKNLFNQKDRPVITCDYIRKSLLSTFKEFESISRSTVHYYLTKKLGYRYKNAIYIDSRKNLPLNKTYRYFYLRKFFEFIDNNQDIISIDETGLNNTCKIRKDWVKTKTNRVLYSNSNWPNISLTIAISPRGLVGFSIREKTNNQFTFLYFIQQTIKSFSRSLDSQLKEPVIVLDNAPFHTTDLCKQAMKDMGARALFTAPYSPQTNPIEYLFNDLKQSIRKENILTQ
jgi:hypothetical protein